MVDPGIVIPWIVFRIHVLNLLKHKPVAEMPWQNTIAWF